LASSGSSGSGRRESSSAASFGRYTSLDLLDATTLALIADVPLSQDPRRSWVLDDVAAERIEQALEDLRYRVADEGVTGAGQHGPFDALMR
jgi:hypothetical protein